jgi:hypothetical protein
MHTPPPPLPDDAVLVHIGPHKTGTTAIQTTLAEHRAALEAHGVTYPGTADSHHLPARALRQKRVGWQSGGTAPPDRKLWDRLVATVAEVPGRVVISSEFFAAADGEAREQLVTGIGKERVHILAAARNPASIALSAWQQTLKQGRISPLNKWLRENFHTDDSEDEDRASGFWSGADPAVLAQRWADAAGAERVTILALDEQDRQLLPATFERLLGLPPGMLVGKEPPMTNRGLTASEAEFVRRVNKAVKDQLEWAEYNSLLRNGVIRRLVEERTPPPTEAKPTLPEWAADVAREESRRVADALASTGVRILGDLASLQTIPEGTPQRGSDKQIRFDAAVEAVVGAVAAATRGSWQLEAPRLVPPPRVEQIRTRELIAIVFQRARRRAGRRRAARRAAREAEQL